MIIFILGIKGGIGKTTFSLYFAKKLASMGKKVLYIDYDYLSFGSLILGHKGIGLVREVEKGLPLYSNSLAHISGFYILKLFTDPLDLNKINLVGNKIYIAIEKITDLDIEYIILDASVGLMQDDIIVASLEKIELVEKGLFLSDIASLNSAIKYSKLWGNLRYKALAINMVPPLPEEIFESKNTARELYSLNIFDTVSVIPFDEKLYNYNPLLRDEDNERLNELLDSILNNKSKII